MSRNADDVWSNPWSQHDPDYGTHPFPLKGRYAERFKWENLAGPGDARPTGLQIVEDEDRVGKLAGKVILITGCSSPQGCGVATLRSLVTTGATIYATARKMEEAQEVLGEWLSTGQVKLLYMDQTDLASVRACAAEFKKQSPRLDILINNAGVMNTPESRTRDGFETQFGVNHLSHFLLFWELRDLLLASSTPDFNARVVSVASSGHRYAPGIAWDNLNLEGTYDGGAAYGQSKLANIYFSSQVERLYGSQGLHANALMPGGWVSPGLQKYSGDMMDMAEESPRAAKYMYSQDQGCATSVYAAISKELEGHGGYYLEGSGIAGQSPPGFDMLEYGYGPQAFDQAAEEKLWMVSKKLVGVV